MLLLPIFSYSQTFTEKNNPNSENKNTFILNGSYANQNGLSGELAFERQITKNGFLRLSAGNFHLHSNVIKGHRFGMGYRHRILKKNKFSLRIGADLNHIGYKYTEFIHDPTAYNALRISPVIDFQYQVTDRLLFNAEIQKNYSLNRKNKPLRFEHTDIKLGIGYKF